MTRPPSRLLVVTDRRLARRPLELVVADALDGGARWVWFRDRDLAQDERRALGVKLARLCAKAGATLSVGGEAEDSLAMGANALHLPAGRDIAAARAALGEEALIGLSAHTLEEAKRAQLAGADYVTLSPIFETASKPGYGPSLGLGALSPANGLSIPVVALGGIDASNIAACLAAGAACAAVMGAIMRATSPRDAVKTLHEAASL